MHTATKYFGPVEYRENDVIHFAAGLFGFEEERRFLLLPFAGSGGALVCLQSLETPGLAFVAMNPFSLLPAYAPQLQAQELRALGVSRSEELCFYVLCVVRDPVAESTVNLKCPVAINDGTREAAQVILEAPEYQMRHRLSGFGRGEVREEC